VLRQNLSQLARDGSLSTGELQEDREAPIDLGRRCVIDAA
jgi:hypothetical protein